jgi:dephospho-CoA kinase
MIIIGLTGSIGMGKTTTANILKELGVPVHDSDVAVHALLAEGGAGEQAVLNAFPSLTKPIDRKTLGAIVFNEDTSRAKLESILHPLVRQSQDAFIAQQKSLQHDVVVLDIPLLFETGAERRVDAVIVVTAPAEVQRERVLSRPNMTKEKFAAILSRQMPDAEKRARADYIIDTSQGLEAAREQVKAIIAGLSIGATD